MSPSKLDLLDHHGFVVLDVVDARPSGSEPGVYHITPAFNPREEQRTYRVALVVVEDEVEA